MAQQGIGMTIRRARERRRWTQRDLAEAVGVSRASVDAWENNRSSPRNRVGALEEVLGINLSGTSDTSVQPGPVPWNVATDDWEAEVLGDPDLDEDAKRDLIAGSRAARDAYDARRAARAARRRAG